jgi:hypothetical protein
MRNGFIDLRYEPCEPKQRPAVKPLEAKIGNGWALETHGREYAAGATRSD